MMSRAFSGALMLFAAMSAMAQDNGWFVDGSIGTAQTRITNSSGFSLSGRESTGGLSVGYMFNKYVGMEAGYRDLGSGSATSTAMFTNRRVSGFNVNGTGTLTINTSADGFTAGPVFRIPVHDKVDLIGRFGWMRYDAPTTAQVNFAGTINSAAVAAGSTTNLGVTRTDTYYSLGAAYKIDKNFRAGVDYSRFSLDALETKVNVWSLRLNYQF